MATEIQEPGAGIDFDGTAGKGEFLFPDVRTESATQRAQILSVSLQSDANLTSLRIVWAPDLASANGTTFMQLINAVNVTGSQIVGCPSLIVPTEWGLFAFAEGTGAKTLVIDWQKVTLLQRC